MSPVLMNANEIRQQADNHYNNGRLREALAAYAMLCKQVPTDAQAWHMQAAICGMLGEFGKAADCCEKVLALAPRQLAAYKNYANSLIKLSRLDDALATLMTARELAPGDTEICSMLAKLCLLMDNPGKAETHFRQALNSSHGDPDNALALARLLINQQKFGESASICETALSHNNESMPLLLTLIECRLFSGEAERCRGDIEKLRTCTDNLATYLVKIVRRMHMAGKHELVIPAARMLASIFPEEYRFYLMLADSQINSGDNNDAINTINSYQAAPLTYEALLLLATAYNNIDDFEHTRDNLLLASDSAPDKEEPVLLLSRLYQKNDKPEHALRLLEAFIEKHPASHHALIEAGNIYHRAADYNPAEQHYKQALNLQPDNAAIHNSLGMVYLNSKMEEEALHCFESAIRIDARLLEAHCNLGLLQRMKGNYEQAIACYDKALAINPESATAIAGKAAAHERMGNTQTALELLEPILQSQPVDVNALLSYANVCHKVSREREAIELLEDALANALITVAERMQIHFAIGKLLDKLKDYDKAFFHYESGNKLNSNPFDREAQKRLTSATISTFSAGNMKTISRSSNHSSELLFIVGMPRSGTTLTEQILSSHPQIYGAGELSAICDIAAAIPSAMGSSQPFPLGIADISRDVLDRLSFGHLQAMRALAPGKQVITDKMPSNFMFLGLIEMLFPKARVLHCVRDPLDNCLSCYLQQFSRGQYFSYDQSDLALFYKLYRRLMEHWKSTLSIPIMDIQYEELINDTEGVSKRMLKFAGLEWDPACADFHSSTRKVLTASYDQVRRPIYKSSVGRWMNYQKHLSSLQEELAGYITSNY